MFELYENFNTTNQTSPHYERHLNFADPVAAQTCALITVLSPEDRCAYAKSYICDRNVYLFRYTAFYFCHMDANELSRIMGIFLIIMICVTHFWLVFIVTDEFFVPALTEISKILHMNENVAGVTILAFGNGAPDFFTSIVGIYSDTESRHIFTDCTSANIFVSIFVAAIIITIRPFSMEPAFFLRDVGFVLFYAIFVDFTIKTNYGVVSLGSALFMGFIYIMFITVVLTDQYLLHRKRKVLARLASRDKLGSYSEFHMLESQANTLHTTRGITRSEHFTSANKHLWKQFFSALNTFDYQSFKRSSHIGQLYALLKVVPLLLLLLLIPRISFEESKKWSKLLCCLQCLTTPTILALGWFKNKGFYDVPIFVPVMLVCLPLSIWAYWHCRTDVVPAWYPYFTILSSLAAVFVIYVVAREIIVSLETLGIALNRSNTFIGCTLYTWGNGIGDLTANVALARQGFPRMAYAACFGAPIFNMFVSIAVPFIYKCVNTPSHSIYMTEGTIGETSSVFLIIGCFSTILYGITTNFMLRRTGGYLGIIIYALFLTLSVAHEFEALHSYGTDHTLDRNRYETDYGRGIGDFPIAKEPAKFKQ